MSFSSRTTLQVEGEVVHLGSDDGKEGCRLEMKRSVMNVVDVTWWGWEGTRGGGAERRGRVCMQARSIWVSNVHDLTCRRDAEKGRVVVRENERGN